MKVKKLVILSDSLGRPRPDIKSNEATEYEDTYGYLLREKLGADWLVDVCYVESLDTLDAKFWSERMVAFRRPNVAVIHIGINDCAPRIFKKGADPIIYRPWFRKLTWNLFGKIVNRFRRQLTLCRQLVYVSPDFYIKNLQEMKQAILKYSPEAKVLFVSIADTSEENDRRSFNYRKNIAAYNAHLKTAFGEDYIDINKFGSEDFLISDGIHLTKSAHKNLAQMIREKIN